MATYHLNEGPLSAASANRRKGSLTVYSEEKDDCVNGKNIKVVEVTGEKDMTKQKKVTRGKSADKAELNVPCHDLGKADHEGWLSKKAGGHGLVPIMWKRYWCVMKDSKLYLYKTSFDAAADYLYQVKEYTVESTSEKKKIAFCMKPVTDDLKAIIFAGSTEEEVTKWMEIVNKILKGVDVSQKDDANVPDYEERKRMFSSISSEPPKVASASKRHSAFQKETETTGMPASFATRSLSTTSAPRTRSVSGKGETVLAVGSMFKLLDENEDTPPKVSTENLLYKEIPSHVAEKLERKPSNELETLIREVEQLKTGTYHLQNQEKVEIKVNDAEVETVAETRTTVEVQSVTEQEDTTLQSVTEQEDTTLPSVTEQEDTTLPSVTEQDTILVSSVSNELAPETTCETAETASEISVPSPSIEISEENSEEVTSATAPMEDEAVEVEVEAVEVEVELDTSITKHVSLTTDLFYTGEKVDENLSEGDDTDIVSATLPTTTEANISEVSESDVSINSSIFESLHESAKEDLEAIVSEAFLDTVGEVSTEEEEEEEATSPVTADTYVATDEVGEASEEDTTEPDISISEDASEAVPIDNTVDGTPADSETASETASVPDSETYEETVVTETAEIDHNGDDAAANVSKCCSEVCSEADEPSENVSEDVIASNGHSDVVSEDVSNGHSDVDVVDHSEHEVEVSVSSNEEKKESTLRHSLRACFADTGPQSGSFVLDDVDDDGVAVTSDVLTTEEVSSESPEESASESDVPNENENITESVTTSVENTAEDVSVAEEDSDFSKTETNDESLLDDVLNVSISSSSASAEESLLDAVMKVSRGNSVGSSEVQSTETETSPDVKIHSKIDVEAKLNGSVVHDDVMINGCDGEASMNGCNGEVSVNGCNGEVLISGCNGDTTETLTIGKTCNGDASISIETTLSPDECNKSLNNSVIEYI